MPTGQQAMANIEVSRGEVLVDNYAGLILIVESKYFWEDAR
jgi:hypothetical protein